VIRTLVVDDDFMVATIHKGYTGRIEGFEVVGLAHSGGEALAAAERLRPDLVVLDVYLPDLSGLDVLRRLRAAQPETDVLMVTAAKDAETLLASMQGGAVHYIVKPFDFDRYRQTLESYRRFRLGRESVASGRAVEQTDVDRLFALRASRSLEDLPKGLNRPTLELVAGHLRGLDQPISASELAEAIGVSRGTARRYLEYLEQSGRARLELRYGTAGRPEHLYRAL
jgi:response regulator of citrate/malate metabolism